MKLMLPGLLLVAVLCLSACGTSPVGGADAGDTDNETTDADDGSPDVSGGATDVASARADTSAGPETTSGSGATDVPVAMEDAILDDADPNFPDGYLDPDYIPAIVDSVADPNAPGPDAIIVPTCSAQCEAIAAAGCGQGPPSEGECLSECGVLESGFCGLEHAEVVTCRGNDPGVLCDDDALPTVAGCEDAESALALCLDTGPPECTDLCPALVEAGCDQGPADESACEADCVWAEGECSAAYEAYANCSGIEPVLDCDDSGLPAAPGCSPEATVWRQCVDNAQFSCADLCAASLEPACAVGPQTAEECVQGCDAQEVACATELGDFVACGKATFFVCHPMDGNSLPVGCDGEVAALDACLAN